MKYTGLLAYILPPRCFATQSSDKRGGILYTKKHMKVVNFDDYKDEINKALNIKVQMLPHDPAGYSIVGGFLTQPIQQEVGSSFTIGGPVLPTIAVVANTSGLVYHFTLKSILPNLGIYDEE